MKTLFMDSSHKHLIVLLLEDKKIVSSVCEECWKKQSEKLFPAVIACMEEANWNVNDLQKVIVSVGPGSYTGVRIALSVAKVLCTQKNIPLYTLSTLQLYAGLNPNTFVMMDARSKRAYCAHYDYGNAILNPQIKTLEEISDYLKNHECNVVGDCNLVHYDEVNVDFKANIQALVEHSELVENIHTLIPCYLKESDAYGK